MADEGFHEIQLSGKHLVALFMAATVVSVVVFLCGVAVGRGVLAKRTADAVEAAEIPTDPTAPASVSPETSAASKESLSYPERLAGTPPPETLKQPSTPPVPIVEAPPPRSAPEPTVAAVQRAPAPPPGDGFAVQVAAVRERSEADTIARRLSTKGYAAYVMAPANGAPRVFRVRVGKFKDRREAEQVATRLEKEEQFKPWVTR